MKIKVNNVTLCRTGGAHVQFDLTINDSVSDTFSESIDSIVELIDRMDNREIGLILMYAHCKKENAVTLAEMKTALLDQEFEW